LSGSTVAPITFLFVDQSSPSFLSSNVGGVVVDHLLFLFSTCGSIFEIFAIKVESCLKPRNFALPNSRGRAFPKSCAHLNTPASRNVAQKRDLVAKEIKLEIWAEPNVMPPGAASPTAETILGGSNVALSNATWRIKVESGLKSRRNSTWVGQHERL